GMRAGTAPGPIAAGAGAGVVLDRGACALRLTGPGTALDLGGVAKGFAVDQAALILRSAGVERALLHGGTSSVAAIGGPGERPGGGVAIQGEGSRIAVELSDASLSV